MKYCLMWLLIFLQDTSLSASPYSALHAILQTLPEWNQDHQLVQIEKIETGFSNHNYKVIFPTRSYFIRLRSPNSLRLGMDMESEYVCCQAAAELGIAPPVICYLPDQQAMAFPYIESTPLDKKTDSYKQLILSLIKYHQSGFELPTTFCPYAVIQDYYRQTLELQPKQTIPMSSHILSIVDEIRQAIPAPTNLVPCHLDLFHRNCLDDGTRLWLVDWEYSAMADPLFDLATLASSEYMSLSEMEMILKMYLKTPRSEDLASMYLMSILADVRWWLWSHIQADSSQIEADYLGFADDALKNILQKVDDPFFNQSLLLLKK